MSVVTFCCDGYHLLPAAFKASSVQLAFTSREASGAFLQRSLNTESEELRTAYTIVKGKHHGLPTSRCEETRNSLSDFTQGR